MVATIFGPSLSSAAFDRDRARRLFFPDSRRWRCSMFRCLSALTGVLFFLATIPAVASGPGVLKFDEVSFEVAETAGVAVVRVERSQGESGAVSVSYATSDGTATAGSDYTPVSGTLSWGSGDESTKTFTVPIASDGVAEGSETIRLTLSNATGGATIDPARGTSTVVILSSGGGGGDDDRRPGVLKFDQSDFAGFEGAMALVAVERSMGEKGTVSVGFRTESGTATSGVDFAAVSGTLTWGPGDGSHKVIEVPLLRDAVADGGETFRVVL